MAISLAYCNEVTRVWCMDSSNKPMTKVSVINKVFCIERDTNGGSERSNRAWSGSNMACRSGEQEQEHGEGRAQRLKQEGFSAYQ